MPSALILEDSSAELELLSGVVQDAGFEPCGASNLRDAREALAEMTPDLVVLDIQLSDGNGLDLVDDIEDRDIHPEIVVVTGNASVASAVEGLRRGICDYLTKPIDPAHLRRVLKSVARTCQLREDVASLRRELSEFGRFGEMIGVSRDMQAVYELIGKVAGTSATVFLTGESGTGKDLAAETIHRMSERRRGPFLPLNCGAVSPNLIESELFGHERGSFTGATRTHRGYFERADGGTLFLDEITEMPIELQVKLLRVLETGKVMRIGSDTAVDVDTRVIAATNRSPERAVTDGKLRDDLFFRLQVFPIRLPPLRERQGDITLLADCFVERLNKNAGTAKTLTKGVIERFTTYSWPGNVRELRNTIHRAFIMADSEIEIDCLPPRLRPASGARRAADGVQREGDVVTIRCGATLAAAEKALILATLDRCDGNKKRAADVLGISVRTLYNRLSHYRKNRGNRKSTASSTNGKNGNG